MIYAKKLKEVVPLKKDLDSILLKYCETASNIEELSKDLMSILRLASEESWINGYTSALIDSNKKTRQCQT